MEEITENQNQNQMIGALKENIGTVLVGKEKVTDLLLSALIAGGHVLLEDVPGTGKTMLAKSLAKSMQLRFSRIQFTPDLLPSDVTGLNYYNQKEGEFVFRQGPVFTNILLADEINRATPRTQSSLLECMEEHQVTIDGQTRLLEEPFFVIATQNPIETAGTYPLPEAQLDRFLLKVPVGIPSMEEELKILNRFSCDNPYEDLQPVCGGDELSALKKQCESIYVHPLILDYMVRLAAATRTEGPVLTGVSPRGTLALLRAAKAYALVLGRSYVVPEDVKELAVPVLAHRLVLARTLTGSRSAPQVIEKLLASVPVPTEDWKS